MARIGLVLSPLDTLFFRDGRPFNAADQAIGSLPTPLPLAGALRTAILAGEPEFDFELFGQQIRQRPDRIADALAAGKLTSEWYHSVGFRGPFLAIQKSAKETPIPLIPVPQNLRRRQDQAKGIGMWFSATPQTNVPGWSASTSSGLHSLLPLWLQDADDDDEYPGGFLTLPAIELYLQNNAAAISDQDWFLQNDVCLSDMRTGIGVDHDTFTAADSQIYGINLLALQTKIHRNWCAPDSKNSGSHAPRHDGSRVVLYAEIIADGVENEVLSERVQGPLPLGGEGHCVNCQPLTNGQIVSWPVVSSSEKQFWLLMAPAILPLQLSPPCWLPAGLQADKVRAAATGQPLAVSGWNAPRNAPRLTRFAIPAGSVFYTEGLSQLTNESVCSDIDDVDDDVRQGWGFALAGVWS